ncbi:MAG: DUF624 domain-containing protein [Lachnospiraceae bacterium]|nr:DUF624 domain-containing protein [Lachnospiraceae bacterium]
MGKLFNLDSPILRALGTLADLCILNIITLIGCLPIITAGASITAMHYVLLKMVRNQDGYVWKDYWKSFKENFWQGTAVGSVLLIFVAFFLIDCYIFKGLVENISVPLLAVAGAFALFLYMIYLYAFPLLSHFHNTVPGTLKNAFFVGIMAFPQTVLMMIVTALPIILLYQYTQILPLVLMYGFTAPGYFCAWLYSRIFKRLEPKAAESEEECAKNALEEEME